MTRLSPRRLIIVLRHTSPLDIIATAIVLIFALSRIALIFRTSIPFEGFLSFLAFLAAVYLFVRLIPWLRNRFMWTLRNRLIVTYVFIAVVPVILLLSMAGLATYGLYLQLGAHLFHDDLQERISTIAADADALAGAVEMEAAHGAEPTSESILQRPGVANLIEAERREWPDLRVLPNRGQRILQSQPADAQHFAGLVELDGKIYIAAAVSKNGPAGPFNLVVATPLNSAFLDSFASEFGPIAIIPLRPGGQTNPTGISLNFNGHVFVPGEQIASRRRTLGPPQNWADIRINGVSTIELAH
ncbi:MAG: hypothetical protein WCA34_06465, partial [Candidatus Acidiferrales bacterium]